MCVCVSCVCYSVLYQSYTIGNLKLTTCSNDHTPHVIPEVDMVQDMSAEEKLNILLRIPCCPLMGQQQDGDEEEEMGMSEGEEDKGGR